MPIYKFSQKIYNINCPSCQKGVEMNTETIDQIIMDANALALNNEQRYNYVVELENFLSGHHPSEKLILNDLQKTYLNFPDL